MPAVTVRSELRRFTPSDTCPERGSTTTSRGLRAFAVVGGVGLVASVVVISPVEAFSDTTEPTAGSEAVTELAGGEDVTLLSLIDNTETTVLPTDGLTSAFSESTRTSRSTSRNARAVRW